MRVVRVVHEVHNGRMGIDVVQASRWAGHSKPSITWDTYGHVMTDPSKDERRGFWRATYAAERSAGVVPVWHEEAENGRDPAAGVKTTLQES